MIATIKKRWYANTPYLFDNFMKGSRNENFTNFYFYGSVDHLSDFGKLIKEDFIKKTQRKKLI